MGIYLDQYGNFYSPALLVNLSRRGYYTAF